jgi:hypothetical protein
MKQWGALTLKHVIKHKINYSCSKYLRLIPFTMLNFTWRIPPKWLYTHIPLYTHLQESRPRSYCLSPPIEVASSVYSFCKGFINPRIWGAGGEIWRFPTRSDKKDQGTMILLVVDVESTLENDEENRRW